MSTLTSRTLRWSVLGAACLTLAACGGGRFGGIGGGAREPAPVQVSVTAGSVVVVGPDGYCVDPTATHEQGDTAFVLLGNCAAISNSRTAGQPQTPAVLTAAISAPSDGGSLADSVTELDGFFRSEAGLALLSRSGEAGTVTILDTAVEGELFFLHAQDISENAIEGVQPEYWRAYLDVGNRIATLSVLTLEDRTLSEAESLVTLRAFANAVRNANLGLPVATDVAPAAVPAQSRPETLPLGQPRLFNVGLFRRILG